MPLWLFGKGKKTNVQRLSSDALVGCTRMYDCDRNSREDAKKWMPFNLYKNPLSEAPLNNIASEYLPRQFLIAKSNELKKEKKYD